MDEDAIKYAISDTMLYKIDNRPKGLADDEIIIKKDLLYEIAQNYKYRSLWEKLKDLFC